MLFRSGLHSLLAHGQEAGVDLGVLAEVVLMQLADQPLVLDEGLAHGARDRPGRDRQRRRWDGRSEVRRVG